MLIALWPTSEQFNDNNGSILTNGKIYVYYSGRAALAPTWSSADGSHVNPNPIILDNNGRAVAFADDQYTYTCVVCDFYGKELFSFDPASFGTGGGGSTTEGNDAAHWIGASGTDVQVTALADTLLPLPSTPDYEGDFVGQTTYTTISLNKGLYMVDADIRIQQDDDDLENIIKDISVYTGLTGPDSLTTSQKNWTGPEASDDRHFVHVHFIRHIADEGEDLYFQVNSPVDLSQAWIEKLSIVKLTEGGNGKSYVGGYGIDITGPVISVSGMIPEASAANFVDVGTYNSDIENIYETIAETSAMIPSGVATEQYVQDYTSAFITSADIPDVPADVVTSGQLATVSGDIVNQIPDTSDMATKTWVGEQGYLTSIPEDLVTSGELATVSGNIMNEIPDTSDMATKTWVGQQGYLTSIPAEYATSADLATVSGRLSIVSTRYQTYFYPMETNYQKLRFNYGSGIPSSAANAQRLVEVGDGSTYTTLGELVPVPSTSGLVLTSLNGNLMAWQEPSGGGSTYTAGDNISIVSDTISVSGTTGLIAGENISITASGDNYVISSTGGGGGVDQVYHDGTLTGDGTQADPLSITSASNWTQAYDAINASAASWNDAAAIVEYPISAGPGMSIEDVDGVTVFQTSGTMMDDLIEYNSQDEISGYNGHPVMTVDSEKQWLTHDDTIAHVTNSAQYAFGVNVPVVAQAMGTDETLLYSHSVNVSACTLSEDIKNFNRFKIGVRTNSGEELFEFTTGTDGTSYDIVTGKGNNQGVISICQFTTSGTNITAVRSQGIVFSWGGSSPTYRSNEDMSFIQNVYGVGRKEN